jgi:hypothetical protein
MTTVELLVRESSMSVWRTVWPPLWMHPNRLMTNISIEDQEPTTSTSKKKKRKEYVPLSLHALTLLSYVVLCIAVIVGLEFALRNSAFKDDTKSFKVSNFRRDLRPRITRVYHPHVDVYTTNVNLGPRENPITTPVPKAAETPVFQLTITPIILVPKLSVYATNVDVGPAVAAPANTDTAKEPPKVVDTKPAPPMITEEPKTPEAPPKENSQTPLQTITLPKDLPPIDSHTKPTDTPKSDIPKNEAPSVPPPVVHAPPNTFSPPPNAHVKTNVYATNVDTGPTDTPLPPKNDNTSPPAKDTSPTDNNTKPTYSPNSDTPKIIPPQVVHPIVHTHTNAQDYRPTNIYASDVNLGPNESSPDTKPTDPPTNNHNGVAKGQTDHPTMTVNTNIYATDISIVPVHSDKPKTESFVNTNLFATDINLNPTAIPIPVEDPRKGNPPQVTSTVATIIYATDANVGPSKNPEPPKQESPPSPEISLAPPEFTDIFLAPDTTIVLTYSTPNPGIFATDVNLDPSPIPKTKPPPVASYVSTQNFATDVDLTPTRDQNAAPAGPTDPPQQGPSDGSPRPPEASVATGNYATDINLSPDPTGKPKPPQQDTPSPVTQRPAPAPEFTDIQLATDTTIFYTPKPHVYATDINLDPETTPPVLSYVNIDNFATDINLAPVPETTPPVASFIMPGNFATDIDLRPTDVNANVNQNAAPAPGATKLPQINGDNQRGDNRNQGETQRPNTKIFATVIYVGTGTQQAATGTMGDGIAVVVIPPTITAKPEGKADYLKKLRQLNPDGSTKGVAGGNGGQNGGSGDSNGGNGVGKGVGTGDGTSNGGGNSQGNNNSNNGDSRGGNGADGANGPKGNNSGLDGNDGTDNNDNGSKSGNGDNNGGQNSGGSKNNQPKPGEPPDNYDARIAEEHRLKEEARKGDILTAIPTFSGLTGTFVGPPMTILTTDKSGAKQTLYVAKPKFINGTLAVRPTLVMAQPTATALADKSKDSAAPVLPNNSTTTAQKQANKGKSTEFVRLVFFSGQYVPTIIAVLLSMLWKVIDTDIKRIEPFYQLSDPSGTTSEALTQNLLFDNAYFIPFQAARRRQWIVFLSAIVYNPLLAVMQFLSTSAVSIRVEKKCDPFANHRTCGDPFLASNKVMARVFQGVVGAIILTILAMIYLQARRKSLLYAEPWSLLGLATLAADWQAMKHSFGKIDLADSEEEFNRKIADQGCRYRLVHSKYRENKHLGIEVVTNPFETAETEDMPLNPPRSETALARMVKKVDRPLMVSNMFLLGFTVFLMGTLVLVTIYRFTHKQALEEFMSTEKLGVKIFFLILGVTIRCGWEPIERGTYPSPT